MDEQYLLLILFGIFCYLIGGLLGRKTLHLIDRIFKERTLFVTKYLSSKYWDYLLLVIATFVIAAFIFLFTYNFKPTGLLETADFIQILIFMATFATLLYTTVINEKPRKEREKSIIAIEFNFFEPDCHKTTTHIDGIQIGDVYYVRMRVKNNGRSTLEGVEVILERVENIANFLPLNLVWALTESQSNRGSVHIPQGSFRTVDIFFIYNLSHLAVFIQQNANRIPPSNLRRFQAMIDRLK